MADLFTTLEHDGAEELPGGQYVEVYRDLAEARQEAAEMGVECAAHEGRHVVYRLVEVPSDG